MWEKYAATEEIPIHYDDIVTTTAETFAPSGDASWVKAFFDDYVRGAKSLPLDGLGEAGLEVVNRKQGVATIGISTGSASNVTARDGGLALTACLEASPIWNAGLVQGDVVIAIDDRRTDSTDRYDQWMKLYQPGQEVEVAYFRDAALRHARVTTVEDWDPDVRSVDGPSQTQREFRSAWLGAEER